MRVRYALLCNKCSFERKRHRRIRTADTNDVDFETAMLKKQSWLPPRIATPLPQDLTVLMSWSDRLKQQA
jgi:hypothetical protein